MRRYLDSRRREIGVVYSIFVVCGLAACGSVAPHGKDAEEQPSNNPTPLARIELLIYRGTPGRFEIVEEVTVNRDSTFVVDRSDEGRSVGKTPIPQHIIECLRYDLRDTTLFPRVDGIPTYRLALEDPHHDDPESVRHVVNFVDGKETVVDFQALRRGVLDQRPLTTDTKGSQTPRDDDDNR